MHRQSPRQLPQRVQRLQRLPGLLDTQAQAQQIYDADPSDPHGLDGSPEDEVACESLP